ncbi:hypothetical protein [Streptomyces sp. NPDC096339]|uniref:hypothetical protein n=1 Tax=Streptomyces sp. NPDC096339 TaxID=3366086 RepID=UPI0038306210
MLTTLLLSLRSGAIASTLRTVCVTALLLSVLLMVTTASLPALLVLLFFPSRDEHMLRLLGELRSWVATLLRAAR